MPAPDARSVALKLAVIKAIKDVLSQAEDEAKLEGMAVFEPGDAKAVLLPDGTSIGKVSCVGPSEGWRVVDEDAFVLWVIANRPSALVTSVRASDQASILAEIEKTGDLPDGVERGKTRNGYLSVRQTPEQKAAIQRADWRDLLELSGTQLPALGEA